MPFVPGSLVVRSHAHDTGSAHVVATRPPGPEPARPGRAASHAEAPRHRVRIGPFPAEHAVDDGLASWLAQVLAPQVVAVDEDLAVAEAADLPEPAFQGGRSWGALVAISRRPPQPSAAVLEHPVHVAQQALPFPGVGQLGSQLT